VLKITVGDVSIEWDKPVSRDTFRQLLMDVSGIAAALSQETEEEQRPTVTLGFSTEIQQPVEEDLSEYFE
jgi:hypothetical protein